MGKFLNNIGNYLLSNAFSAAIPFILLPILTRQLSLSDYGELSIFQSLITGFGAFVGLNTVGAAARKYYDNVSDKELISYNSSCFFILIFSFVISFIFLLCFLFLFKSKVFNVSVFIPAVIISFFNYILLFRLSQYQIRSESNKYLLLQMVRGVLLLSFVLIFLFIGESNLNHVVLGYFSSGAVVAILSFLSLHKSRLLSLRSLTFGYINDAMKFGFPLVPHVLGVFLLGYIDRIIIANSLGIEKAAIYMLGIQVSLSVVVIFDALNKALLPWLYKCLKKDDELIKLSIVKWTYKIIFLIVIFAFLLYFTSPFFITIIAGEKYQAARNLIGWLFIGQCFIGCYMLFTNYLFFERKTVLLSSITLTTGLFHALCVSYVVDMNDLDLVAKVFAFSMFVRFLLTAILANVVHPMPWKKGLNI